MKHFQSSKLPSCFLIFLWGPMILSCLSCTSKPYDTLKEINASHPSIYFEGRVVHHPKGSALFDWAGTGFSIRVQTDIVSLHIEDEEGSNDLNVFIDQQYDQPLVIDCKKGVQTYTITFPDDQQPHLLEVYKRTGRAEGGLILHSMSFGKNGGNVFPVEDTQKKLRIEFYGDSQTEGYSIENNNDNGDPQYKNNFMTYAAQTARSLQAAYSCIAISGIGLKKSWVPGTMFDFYNLTYGYDHADTLWDFSHWQADIVVINLGQNDFSLQAGNITPEYISFVKQIRSHYPEAKIILCLGDMNSCQSETMIQYQKEALRQLQDPETYLFTFQYGGLNHPGITRNTFMAKQLTTFIMDMMEK